MSVEVVRTVRTRTPVKRVAAYLSDFTTTQTWDPNTVSCTRLDDGPLKQGSTFDNVQRIGLVKKTFRYRIEELRPGRKVVLRSSNATMVATDTMEFTGGKETATEVRYTAHFDLKGPARLAEPLLRISMNRLADKAAKQMKRTLDELG